MRSIPAAPSASFVSHRRWPWIVTSRGLTSWKSASKLVFVEGTITPIRLRTPTPSLHVVLEPFDSAPGIVRQREDLVELDLRPHAVALDDAVEPRSAVKALGILERLPLIDASRPAALAPDEVLADQALHVLEAGRDRVEMLPARRVVDVRRKLVSDGGRDHVRSLRRSGRVISKAPRKCSRAART